MYGGISMRIIITGDSTEGDGVSEVLYEISSLTERRFRRNNYGVGLLGLCVVLMCRDQEYKFKRRIRLARKEKHLYMDVMLDLERMRKARRKTRRNVIMNRLLVEVPEVLQRYALADFAQDRFVKDWTRWVTKIKQGPAT